MMYLIHPKDLAHILSKLGDLDCGDSARIASDLREQFHQQVLPVTREVRERPKLRLIQGGVL